MDNEKNMIEINLNTPISTTDKKEFSYFGNIEFDKAHNFNFPYGKYQNEENVKKLGLKIPTKFFGVSNDNSKKISSLRQMYCPDCQERLDEDSILMNRHGVCCFSLLLVTRLYKLLKFQKDRRIYCKNCGGDMGYLKCV